MAKCRKCQINEELAAARLGQSDTENQKTDNEVGECLHRDAEHALCTEDVIGCCIRKRATKAGYRAGHNICIKRI